MKIVTNQTKMTRDLLVCSLFLGLACAPVVVHAQTDASNQVAVPAAAAPSAAPHSPPAIATPASPAAAMPAVVPPPSADSSAPAHLPEVAGSVTPAKEEKEKRSLSDSEQKLTDNIKGVAKRLSDTDNVTLDDLNTARQTVAKIDALIEVEKHLAELQKLREDRENSGGDSGSPSALPASALSPMGHNGGIPTLPIPASVIPASALPPSMPIKSMIAPVQVKDPDVDKIVGFGSRFSAVLKTSDGQSKTVSVGDQVDGATVTAITASGVEVMRNNKKKTLHVRNIDTVFSNIP